MPTAEQFYQYAARFDDLADAAEMLSHGPAGLAGDEVVTGGVLGRAVSATLDATESNGRAAAITLRELAETCRDRGARVAAYAAELAAYHEALDRYRRHQDGGFDAVPLPKHGLPRPPLRPPVWVEL